MSHFDLNSPILTSIDRFESFLAKDVFLQLRNKFEFPAKTIFSNISTAIGGTAVSYL